MSTDKHTALAFGSGLTAANLNAPLGELDAAIVAVEAGLAGSSLAVTTTDATAASGQKVVPVTATDNFIAGQSIFIGDIGGTYETRIIDTIQAGVSLTVTVNLTNTYAAGKIVSASPSELVQARGVSATLDARLDALDAGLDALPLGALGYAEVAVDQGGITAEVDLTGLSVMVTLAAARRIRISAQSLILSTVADDRLGIDIKEGATYLQRLVGHAVKASESFTIEGAAIVTPGAGAHTYKLSGRRALGTGSMSTSTGAGFPAFILVEDMGPA